MQGYVLNGLLASLLLLVPVVVESAQSDTPPVEQQIEEAVNPLPESMRESAAVWGYDDAGTLVLLREGTSNISCIANDASVLRGYVVTCYYQGMEAYVKRSMDLTKNGADTPERMRTLKAELDDGSLTLPDRGVIYERAGNDQEFSDVGMKVFLPNATPQSTGLTSLPSRQHPWLREPGTSQAHIMIPME
tara:strand:- start:8 stop:577 length:570 start_codon:yes stop_codon:yes gene_type:complete